MLCIRTVYVYFKSSVPPRILLMVLDYLEQIGFYISCPDPGFTVVLTENSNLKKKSPTQSASLFSFEGNLDTLMDNVARFKQTNIWNLADGPL